MPVFISGISSIDESDEKEPTERNEVQTVAVRDDEQPGRLREQLAALRTRVEELERRAGVIRSTEESEGK